MITPRIILIKYRPDLKNYERWVSVWLRCSSQAMWDFPLTFLWGGKLMWDYHFLFWLENPRWPSIWCCRIRGSLSYFPYEKLSKVWSILLVQKPNLRGPIAKFDGVDSPPPASFNAHPRRVPLDLFPVLSTPTGKPLQRWPTTRRVNFGNGGVGTHTGPHSKY